MALASAAALLVSMAATAGTGTAAAQATPSHHGPAAYTTFAGLNDTQSDLSGSKVPPPGDDGGFDYAGLGSCDGGAPCLTPGDPDLAAGPSELVETENCAIGTFSKTGTELGVTDIRPLFGLTFSAGCYDPRVIYIPWIARFAISYGDNGSPGDPIRFAISTTSNPSLTAADWHEYATPAGPGYDQPKIEATATSFVVAGNTSPDEDYYVYDLAQLAAGNASPAVRMVSGIYDVSVATVNNEAPTKAYFVAVAVSNIYLTEVTGDPLQNNVGLTYFTYNQATTFPAPPQVPDGTIDDVDNRPLSAAYEVQTVNNDPVIDFSGNTDCNGFICAYDDKFDLSQPTPYITKIAMLQQYGDDLTMGSTVLDAAGNAYLPYSSSNSTTSPGAGVAAEAPWGGQLWSTQLHAGSDFTSCGVSNPPPCGLRWGDYFGGGQDPSNPSMVWVVSAYQTADDGFNYNTIITEVDSAGVVAN